MSWLKRALLWVMSAFYVVAGVMHLVRPDYYMAMMPPYLPAHAFLVWLSGVAELAFGILVVDSKARRWAAWGLIALLIAVFPANIHIALNNIPVFGATEGAGLFNWFRLPFQALFILWAWWYTRPETVEAPPPVRPAAADDIWIAKPEILRRMDDLSRNPEIVSAALRALETRADASLLDLGVEFGYVDKRPEEHDHLARDWFDSRQGWWKSLPAIEPALRAAFIRAGHLVLETKLPVESYWIRGGERFEIAMGKTDRAIILLFLSPFPPVAGKRVGRDLADLWLFGAGGIERIGGLIGRA